MISILKDKLHSFNKTKITSTQPQEDDKKSAKIITQIIHACIIF